MSQNVDKVLELFSSDLKVVNLGITDFAENLKNREGVETIHVDWSPPAGGDNELLDLLDKLK